MLNRLTPSDGTQFSNPPPKPTRPHLLHYAAAVASNTAGQASFAMNFLLLFSLVFTGFLVNVNSIPGGQPVRRGTLRLAKAKRAIHQC